MAARQQPMKSRIATINWTCSFHCIFYFFSKLVKEEGHSRRRCELLLLLLSSVDRSQIDGQWSRATSPMTSLLLLPSSCDQFPGSPERRRVPNQQPMKSRDLSDVVFFRSSRRGSRTVVAVAAAVVVRPVPGFTWASTGPQSAADEIKWLESSLWFFHLFQWTKKRKSTLGGHSRDRRRCELLLLLLLWMLLVSKRRHTHTHTHREREREKSRQENYTAIHHGSRLLLHVATGRPLFLVWGEPRWASGHSFSLSLSLSVVVVFFLGASPTLFSVQPFIYFVFISRRRRRCFFFLFFFLGTRRERERETEKGRKKKKKKIVFFCYACYNFALQRRPHSPAPVATAKRTGTTKILFLFFSYLFLFFVLSGFPSMCRRLDWPFLFYFFFCWHGTEFYRVFFFGGLTGRSIEMEGGFFLL